MIPIAYIHTDFPDKFGIPRQSGLVRELEGRIVFEPSFCKPEALRGLEDFSYIWLLWDFSEVKMADAEWSPTVRPPRLGGNTRMGVFATRSPFRPNHIGLSSVKLERIDWTSADGPALIVSGADLKDGTPILDIKPYLPFTDAHPEAKGGFAAEANMRIEPLQVVIPSDIAARFTEKQLAALKGILEQDPRPHYQHDPNRIYGLRFAQADLHFRVENNTLTVLDELE